MLVCSVCRAEKPAEQFHKDVTKRRGHTYACRECVRARRKGRHSIGRPREYDPVKDRARSLLRGAVFRKRMTKPEACEACKTATPKHLLDGHHYLGYDKPLNVKWLCRPCHTTEGVGW